MALVAMPECGSEVIHPICPNNDKEESDANH